MNHPSQFAHLFELPLAERLQLVEDLWDSIAADSGADVPLDEAVHRELLARKRALEAAPESALSWEQVRSRMREC
jgi:putative addiction module component (TIGR02574 family)